MRANFSTWFFFFLGGRNLPLERRHHIFENGTLSINKVIRKDAGLYACTATNRQGQSATQSGQLKVIGKPYLFPWTSNYWLYVIILCIPTPYRYRRVGKAKHVKQCVHVNQFLSYFYNMIFYVAAQSIWKEPKNNENQEISFC